MDEQNVINAKKEILKLKKGSKFWHTMKPDYAKWNKPVTKGQVCYDSPCMSYLEQPNSQRQNVKWWLPAAARRGNKVTTYQVQSFSFAKKKKKLCGWMMKISKQFEYT
jgi:hypothetical protein